MLPTLNNEFLINLSHLSVIQFFGVNFTHFKWLTFKELIWSIMTQF